jgi:hypothetical protein
MGKGHLFPPQKPTVTTHMQKQWLATPFMSFIIDLDFVFLVIMWAQYEITANRM